MYSAGAANHIVAFMTTPTRGSETKNTTITISTCSVSDCSFRWTENPSCVFCYWVDFSFILPSCSHHHTAAREEGPVH